MTDDGARQSSTIRKLGRSQLVMSNQVLDAVEHGKKAGAAVVK